MSDGKDTLTLIGPFVGSITDSGVKIWLHMSSARSGQAISVDVTVMRRRMSFLRKITVMWSE